MIAGFSGMGAALDLPVAMHDLAMAMFAQADTFTAKTPEAQQTHADQEGADKQFGQMRKMMKSPKKMKQMMGAMGGMEGMGDLMKGLGGPGGMGGMGGKGGKGGKFPF